MIRSFCAALFVAGLVACGSSDDEAKSSSSFMVGTCSEVETEEVEHACLHGTAGPFQSVLASTATPPDVSRAHTTYRVQLEALAGGQFGGAVSFVPAEAGEYSVYASADIPEIQLTREGVAIDFECSTPVPTELCGSLRRLRVADLPAGAPVVLGFTSSAATEVVLVVEHREHAHDDGHDDHDHEH